MTLNYGIIEVDGVYTEKEKDIIRKTLCGVFDFYEGKVDFQEVYGSDIDLDLKKITDMLSKNHTIKEGFAESFDGYGDDISFVYNTESGNWVEEGTEDVITDVITLEEHHEKMKKMYDMLDTLCKNIRDKYEDDDVCGLCEYDGACIGESGDWVNECPGFEKSDCFCMKEEIRQLSQ